MFERVTFTIGETLCSVPMMNILSFLAAMCITIAIICSVMLVVSWVIECILESYHYERQLEEIAEEYYEWLDENGDKGVEGA